MKSFREYTLLFLDEIQAVPEAIAALRYFYEDMSELPVVSAGSLLEFALADHNFSMPVGRIQYLHMGPMTFTEFLLAMDEVGLHKSLFLFIWLRDWKILWLSLGKCLPAGFGIPPRSPKGIIINLGNMQKHIYIDVYMY